jgi:twitching motility protein PilT
MPVHERLDALLAELTERNGSDIILSSSSPPRLRVSGELRPAEGAEPLSHDDIEDVIRTQLGAEGLEQLKQRKELDFSFSWRDIARVRANAFYQRGTCSLALRSIPRQIPSPEALGIPPVLTEVVRSPSGLVLVTGATGSGKSTTLAAMIDTINSQRPCHIVTIEDPIEYLHDHKVATVSQREIGVDTDSFHNALRSVLREDPDVVLIGEMRDPESIAAALTIAETGHLVFATLHTNDTAQAIDRIVDVFPADRRPQIQIQLAGTLLAVIYQRLVRRLEGGRVAAFEIMLGLPSVRNLVREGKTRQLRNVVATGRSDGMQTLEISLTDLIDRGLIDYQSAMDASLYPQELPRPDGLAVTRTNGVAVRR